MELAKIVEKASTELALNEKYAFWAALILRLKHTEVPAGHPCDTACTDGLSIMYNLDFMNKLRKDEWAFVLAHETGHVVHLHCTDYPADVDHDLWNQAGDYVINWELQRTGMKMPTTIQVLIDQRFAGMTTLAVYRILQQEEQQKPGKHKGKNQMPDFNPSALSKDEKANIQEEIDKLLLGANLAADMAGLPGGDGCGRGTPDMQRRIEDLLHPTIPWQHLLLNFCKKVVRKPGRNWGRLRRRLLVHDITAPERRGKALDRISIATDGSGSIGQREFTVFMGGVYDVLRICKPAEVLLYQFDDGIRARDILKSVRDLLTLKFKGGGGTDVYKVIEDFNKDPKTHALIILTDGYLHQGHLPRPNRPVIWAVFDNPKFIPEFGDIVHFSMNDVKGH